MRNWVLISEYFPIILIENFSVPTKEQKDFIVKSIVRKKEKNNDNNSGANNVKVTDDYDNFIKNTYNKFVSTSKEILNPFTISKNNSTQAWTYCTNQYDHIHVWHNHITTSTINSVYYLQVPNCGGGQLEIEYNNKRLDYLPKENDFIIFPNFINHAPRRPFCDQYRISINFEIACEENSKQIFSKILNILK